MVGYGIMDTVKAVDRTFLLIFSIAAVLFFLISISLIVILFRYHHRRHPQAASFEGNFLAELIWVAAPSLIVLAMFISGWKSYLALQTPPAGAMQANVTARRWSWTFTYENGRVSSVLYIPVNRAVFLKMKSLDVIHSFYASAFRVKRDIVPGMTTSLWFRPRDTGSFDIMCAEYCGQGHSKMRTKIVVLTQEEFDRWYKGGKAPEGGEEGRELFVIYGCGGCHPDGDDEGIGPPLENIYGEKRPVITNSGEGSLIADEEYIRRSILHPQEEIVKGYQPVMPSLRGQITDIELNKLVQFLKSIQDKNHKGVEASGKAEK